jgi:hypothetical protein
MKGFAWVNRVAFILNLLYLVCLFLRYYSISLPESIVSTLVIGGWLLSFIFNILLIGLFFVLKLQKAYHPQTVSLFRINVLIFLFQILYFFS